MRSLIFGSLATILLFSGLGCGGTPGDEDLTEDGPAGDAAPAPARLHTLYGTFDLARQTLPELVGLGAAAIDAPAAALSDSAPVAPSQGPIAQRYIVQYAALDDAARALVVDQGIQVLGYLPEDALLVRALGSQVSWLRAQPGVVAVVLQPALLKLHPQLVQHSAAGPRLFAAAAPLGATVGPAMRTYRLELQDPNDQGVVIAAVHALGGEVVAYSPHARLLRIEAPAAALGALLPLPQVAAIEPYRPLRLLNDRSYGIVQGGRAHRAPIWTHGLYGAGQRVGVCDTGVDVDSCFFAGQKVAAYLNYAGIDDHDGDLEHGHGTHVAGSIAGDRGNNGRYDLDDGMAPAAQLVVQDVGNGADLIGLPDDLGELFADAYAQGVRIHSNSWGGGDNSYDAVARSVDVFVAAHPDFLPLFANGNEGDKGDSTVNSPATAKSVLSIAAVDGAHPTVLADFSSRGPTADLRVKPTLAAPGVAIASAKRGAACAVTTMSGTSMATPTAAGAVALAREYFVRGYYPSGRAQDRDALQPSAALLRAVMVASAEDLSGGTWGSFPGRGQGFGRLQLEHALRFADAAPRLFVADAVDPSRGLRSGQSAKYVVQHTAPGSLKVALTWTDVPGVAGAKKALVNDLDLVVTGPDGAVYHGNLFNMGASRQVVATSQAYDARNVEEVIVLPHAPLGAYTLTVRASRVPMGPQTFALVAVGAYAGTPRAAVPQNALPEGRKAAPLALKATLKRPSVKKEER